MQPEASGFLGPDLPPIAPPGRERAAAGPSATSAGGAPGGIRPEDLMRYLFSGLEAQKITEADTPDTLRSRVRRFAEWEEEPRDHALPEPYSSYAIVQLLDQLKLKVWDERDAGHDDRAKEFYNISAELATRKAIHDAIAIYCSTIGDLSTIAKTMFLTPSVAFLTSQQFQRLLTLPKTREADTGQSFGDQIDAAMRIYDDLALGNLTVPELGPRSNMFAYALEGPSKDKIRQYVRKQTRASESAQMWAENLYRFWGEAALNGLATETVEVEDKNRLAKDAIVMREEQLSSKLWKVTLASDLKGAPASDDLVKIMHFGAWGRLQARNGAPHGPDNLLQRPKRLATSFLRFATVGEKENIRSFYELWKNGTKLGALPWEKVGINVFRDWLLRIFFAGFESDGPQRLFSAMSAERPKGPDLLTPGQRAFRKAENICINSQLVLNGQFGQFFANGGTPGQLESLVRTTKISIEEAWLRGAELANSEKVGRDSEDGTWSPNIKYDIKEASKKAPLVKDTKV